MAQAFKNLIEISKEENEARKRLQNSPFRNFIGFFRQKEGETIVEEAVEVSEEKYERLKESVA